MLFAGSFVVTRDCPEVSRQIERVMVPGMGRYFREDDPESFVRRTVFYAKVDGGGRCVDLTVGNDPRWTADDYANSVNVWITAERTSDAILAAHAALLFTPPEEMAVCE